MRMKIILRVLLVICILSVLVFASLLVREFYIDRQSQSFYFDLVVGVDRRVDEQEQSSTAGASAGQSPGVADFVPYVDFEALDVEFPGIVGWIRLEGTLIDYPVMQYSDNDFFLTHLPDGTPHRNGSIFLDYRNSSDFSDKSILIFGHESRNLDMFGVLKNYRNQEFFDLNPIMYLHTPQNDYKLVLFAGHLAHSQRDHPPMEFENDEDFLDYIEHIKSISFFSSNVEVSATDRIVSLCTCAYDFNEARLIIVGILVEE